MHLLSRRMTRVKAIPGDVCGNIRKLVCRGSCYFFSIEVALRFVDGLELQDVAHLLHPRRSAAVCSST